MRQDSRSYKFWVALAVAPLMAPLFFALTWVNPSEMEFTIEGTQGFVAVLLAFYVIGAPIAYVVTVLVGVPVFKLLKQRGLIGFIPLSIAGAGISTLLFFFIWLVWSGASFDMGNKPYFSFLPGVVLGGFGVAAAFWLIYVRGSNV